MLEILEWLNEILGYFGIAEEMLKCYGLGVPGWLHAASNVGIVVFGLMELLDLINSIPAYWDKGE